MAAAAAASKDIRVAPWETLCPLPLPPAPASRDQACLLSPDAVQPLIPLVEPDSVWLSRSFSPSLPLSPPRCFDFALASLFVLARSLSRERRLTGGSRASLQSQTGAACGAWKQPPWQPGEERASAAARDPGVRPPVPCLGSSSTRRALPSLSDRSPSAEPGEAR